MLSRVGRISSVSCTTLHHSKRCMVISPAINDHAAHHFPAVLPFGFDFVSDELRDNLESRNVDVEELEKKYNNQIQNDAEFNNPALPSQGSKLWGFVYANRLVKAKVQLKTLTDEEDFMTNYLRAQIEELETRMKRYYPYLDWRGEYSAELGRARETVDNNYENARMDAIGSIVTRDGGDDAYISMFGNNSFIDQYDENDKFCDVLPSNMEDRLVKRFEFHFDHSSDNVDAAKYFDSIQKIEKMIETPMNALSKELKQNFGLFVLDCFGSNNLKLVSDMIGAMKSASGLMVSDDEASVDKCLSLLDIKTGKVSKTSGDILAKLFFGNCGSAKQLSGKDVNQLSSILGSAGEERVRLIYNALQLESCLKQNGVARLFLTLLLNMNRNFMGQFLSDSDNIDSFGSVNSSAMDNIVSTQKAFYQSQEKLSESLSKFVDNLVAAISKDKKCDKDDLTRFVKDSIVSDKLPVCSSNGQCVLIDGLTDYGKECRENGDIFGELKSLTYAKYLELSQGSLYWYELFNGLLNPPRNGLSGNKLSCIAHVMANDTSNASDVVFEAVGSYLQQNGLLSESESQSIGSSLSSLVSGDWDALRTASNEYEKTRAANTEALKSISLNMDGDFHFEHVVDTYDPLNIHLAQYRYLTPN